MNILWIDDQPDTVDAVIRTLEEFFDIHVVICGTVAEMVREYNRSPYDVIVLDRSVPRGNVLWVNDAIIHELDEDTGEALLSDLRKRLHLQSVPVVFYTQYYSEEFRKRMEVDPRVKVISKDAFADDLASVLQALKDQYPVNKDVAPEVVINDHFSVAPYYITEVKSKERFLIEFTANPTEVRNIGPGKSSFYDFFAHMSTVNSDCVEVVWPKSERQSGSVVGLYFTGRLTESRDFREYVMFETIVDHRHDVGYRRFSGVGKAMVVRFIRECIWDSGHTEQDILLKEDVYDSVRPEARASHDAKKFLIHLGFTETDERNVLRLPYEKAVSLLKEVSSRDV